MAESNPNAAAAAAMDTTAASSSSSPPPPAQPATTTTTTTTDKPICPICYEELHAVSELLQSVPDCGHVFHEFCLQHWTDYCLAGREPSCPVCKRSYAQHPPTRLYFQSTADSGETQEPAARSSNSTTGSLPQGAVIRMELRISALDARVRDVDSKVNRLYRETANRELTLLSELSRKEQLHIEKTAELAKKTSECNNFKKKNSSLSKELSALNVETRKLKSRCNILTRSEARTQRKLDEALKLNKQLKEKIEEFQRESHGATSKALGKRKAEAISSKLYASLKDEKVSRKCKTEAVASGMKRTVVKTKSVVTKKALVLNDSASHSDFDEKVSQRSTESSSVVKTPKCVRRVRGLRSLVEPQKSKLEVDFPKMENKVTKGRRSKVGKN